MYEHDTVISIDAFLFFVLECHVLLFSQAIEDIILGKLECLEWMGEGGSCSLLLLKSK